mmetsp:Transcript_48267/g.75209  ORF Transcript_48267/g.75209 Transcript_48267/m.75209 type:complete len:444 (-) Transcript_48267:91-1422(-)
MGSDYSESVVSLDLPHDFLPAAGLSTFRRTHHASTKAHFTKGEAQSDLSMMKGPRWQRRSMPRLDPASMHNGNPAGGVTKVNRMECHKAKIANKLEDPTDPITHFKHDPYMKKKVEVKEHFAKRMGYDHGAATQTWTWAQEPKVVAELGLDVRPEFIWQKYQIGADGRRHYNVCGVEDLLPAATQEYFKADLQPQKENIARNDKKYLAYCIREGHQQRPVHSHFKSDDMWAVMKHEVYINQVEKEKESQRKEKELRSQRSAHTQTRFREASWSEESADEDFNRKDDVIWHRSDTSWASDPSPSAPSNRGPALSMTPRSFNRGSRTSRSLTPRSSLRSSRSLTPRILPLDSAISAASSTLEPRSKPSTIPAGASVNHSSFQIAPPKPVPSPRSVASRSSVASLSMAPQLISRRAGGSTPLNLTPRSVTSGRGSLRKSSSEAAIR